MPEMTPVSLEELHSATASAAALAEANSFRTIPTNYYKLQGTKYDAGRNAKGRLIIACRADASKEDKKLGSVSFYISNEVGRTSAGKLDREFRLYNQLARVLYPEFTNDQELAAVSVDELLSRFLQYPVGGFITETFSSQPDAMTGKKSYFDAKTDAEAREYREKGWKPSNYVQSIGKVK